MYLTRAEVAELTDSTWKKVQYRVLKENRIPFFLSATGRPVVLRSAVEGTARDDHSLTKKGWRSNAA